MSAEAGAESKHLLPSSANAGEKALSLAVRYGDEILPEDIKGLWHPQATPARFLSFLAWGLHLDVWDDSLDNAVKRALIYSSFEWHRHKGSVWSVKKVLRDLEVEPIVHEWFDLGTLPHTFAIEAFYTGDPYQIHFMEERINKLLWQAVEMTKPARSHLLYLVLLPSELKDPDHCCVYDVCAWGHGILPTVPLSLGELRIPLAPKAAKGMTRGATVAGILERFPCYDACVFGHPLPRAGQWRHSALRRSVGVDRELSGWQGWYHRRRWSDGGTWRDAAAREDIGVVGGLLSAFTKSAAVWGHARFDARGVMEPRAWRVPDIGRFDGVAYADRDGSGAGWVPIREYRVRKECRALCIASIWDSSRIAWRETRTEDTVNIRILDHSYTRALTLCRSGRVLHTAVERYWDAEPWDKGTWRRPLAQRLLSKLPDATITTITKEEGI